jgi:RNA polymerase sigma-70 factor (ECF subfamily)
MRAVPGRADDVAQEARFAAWRRPPASPEDARGFMATLVARFAANRRRDDARRSRRETAVARPEVAATAVDEIVAREEARRRLLAAVDALEAPLRAVVLLRWFDGRPPREIVRTLGVPAETVKSRLKRAHAQLREILERDYGGRDAWIAALLPLARVETIAAAAVGGMLVTAKTWCVAAAVVVVAGWLFGRSRDAASDLRDTNAGAAPTATEAARDVATTRPENDRGPAISAAVAATPFAEAERGFATFVVLRAADRAPRAGVDVALLRADGTLARATADAAGVVRFPPGRGAAQIGVAAPGRPPVVFDGAAEAGRTELIVADGETLRGRVTVDGVAPGRPIRLVVSGVRAAGTTPFVADALAEALRAPGVYEPRDVAVTTTEDGAFVVGGLAPAAGRPAYVEPLDRWFEIAPEARADAHEESARVPRDGGDVVVPLVALRAFRCRLRAHDGGPPPQGTTLRALALVPLADGGRGGRPLSAELDAEGAFSVPVPRGPLGAAPFEYQFAFRPGPGAAERTFEVRLGGSDRQDVPEELRLPPLRDVRVLVRDSAGAPVAGAEVGDANAAPGPYARTDTGGVATVRLLRSDAAVRVSGADAGLAYADAAPNDHEVVVRLIAGGRVRVRVVDALGGPQAGSDVELRYPWSPLPGTHVAANALFERGTGNSHVPGWGIAHDEVETRARTDREGYVALRGLPVGGIVRASADAGDGTRIEGRATVAADGPVDIVLRLPRALREYAVRALDAEGRPVAAQLTVAPTPNDAGLRASRVGVDGVLRVTSAPWPKAWLTVKGRVTDVPATFEATPTDDGPPLVVRLRAGRTLRFSLIDDAGDPVLDATPYLKGLPTHPVLAAKGERGDFEILGVGDAPPTLVLSRADVETEKTLALTEAPQAFVVPSVGRCEFAVEGVAEGAADAAIDLERLDAAGPRLAVPVTCTKGETVGRASFDEVVVGRYRATLRRRVDGAWRAAGDPVVFDVVRRETVRARFGPR